MGAAGSRLAVFSLERPRRDSAPPRSSSVTFMQSGVSLGATSVGASRRLRPPLKPSTWKDASLARGATFGTSVPARLRPLLLRALVLVVLAHPHELALVLLLGLPPGRVVHFDEPDRRRARNEDGVVVVPERVVVLLVHEPARDRRAVRLLVREAAPVAELVGQRGRGGGGGGGLAAGGL